MPILGVRDQSSINPHQLKPSLTGRFASWLSCEQGYTPRPILGGNSCIIICFWKSEHRSKVFFALPCTLTILWWPCLTTNWLLTKSETIDTYFQLGKTHSVCSLAKIKPWSSMTQSAPSSIHGFSFLTDLLTNLRLFLPRLLSSKALTIDWKYVFL